MKTYIINGKVILENKVIETNVVIENERIIALTDTFDPAAHIIDAMGQYVSPGFFDVHIHGNSGCDVMEGTFESLNTISKVIAKYGVTSFLPTTLTQSFESTYQAVKNVKENKDKLEGARALGVHLEGPFFDKTFKGAQPEAYLAAPSIENYQSFLKECEDEVRMISLAPEKEGALDLIRYVVSKGVVASIGHTAATYDQAIKSFDAGITHATHTFNGMLGFNHREPGTVGAILEDDRVYGELILDGIHVHYASAKVLMKAKGIQKVILVTDCMMAGNLVDGEYALGGQSVFVKQRAARLASGALAGSTLNLNEAVKNAYHELKLPIYEAVNLASLNPALNFGLTHIGSIAVGKDADIILFDEDINVQKVMIKGKVI